MAMVHDDEGTTEKATTSKMRMWMFSKRTPMAQLVLHKLLKSINSKNAAFLEF